MEIPWFFLFDQVYYTWVSITKKTEKVTKFDNWCSSKNSEFTSSELVVFRSPIIMTLSYLNPIELLEIYQNNLKNHAMKENEAYMIQGEATWTTVYPKAVKRFIPCTIWVHIASLHFAQSQCSYRRSSKSTC